MPPNPYGPEWVPHDLQIPKTPSEERISSTQNKTHKEIMSGLAKSFSMAGNIVGTGTELVTIGTKGAAEILFKGGRGIVRGLSA